MNIFERFIYGCFGVALLLAAGIFLVVFWPLGLVLGYFCIIAFAKAADKPRHEIINRGSSSTATLEFGHAGPPVPEGTPPIQVNGMMIFPTAIRSITFYPPSPPDLQVSPNGVTTPIVGSGRGHYSRLQLESLDEVTVCGQDDISLRYWVLQYVPSTAGLSAGISLTAFE